MIKDPFAEYIRHIDAEKKEKSYAWKTAIGLQDVDGLKPSHYLINTAIKNIEGEITIETAENWISQYYQQNPISDDEDRTEEADKVAVRIARLLSEPAFSFNAQQYLSIHKYLFNGIFPHAGKIRTFNITKKEWVLNGDTISYGSALELKETLEYDLAQEQKFSYKGISIDEAIDHLAFFIARLWQIHVFEEGNTRTTAVFFIKYLKTLGFQVSNDNFADNSWYFRNALVRANYNNITEGIHETAKYLVLFIHNLLLNENHVLSNQQLHIHYANHLQNLKKQKQDIGEEKQDIEEEKQDIEEEKQDKTIYFEGSAFSEKTKRHIQTLYQCVKDNVFSRADVIKYLSLTPSPASELLRKMLASGIIKKANGLGKGKYRF
ncbi:cell filamentation protein Fic [Stutzerimonas stutzeri]|nr:cell filamentation protein Fic [Stutzerimonas stutzeri]